MRRPSLFQSVCDEVVESRDINFPIWMDNSLAPRKSASSIRSKPSVGLCACLPFKYHSSSQVSLGSMRLFRCSTCSYKHHKDCPCSSLSKKEETLGIRFSHCGYLLARTIQASMTITWGAGGLSISPDLNFRAVVSSESPAFSLIRQVIQFDFSNEVIEQTLREIFKLFIKREASPTDVDEYGNTLLHVRHRFLAHAGNSRLNANPLK